MEKEKRLVLVSTDDNDPRLYRFVEEAEKIGIEHFVISSYKCEITESEIYCDKKLFVPRRGDVFWCISNSMVNHYLALIIGNKGYCIWPSHEAANFSDKYFTCVFFAKNGVDIPKTVLVNSFDNVNIKESASFIGGFPCVIKSNKGSMGKNVELINSEKEAVDFMRCSMGKVQDASYPFKKYSFQLQEFIKESSGTDFRVICLDGEIVSGIRRKAKSGFKANISLGGNAEIFEVNKELRDICKKILSKGKIFYAGIDFVKRGEKYLAIEINTSSQFEGFERATGVNLARKIIDKLTKQA